MHFLLLLFLMIACIPEEWGPPMAWVGTPQRSAALTWMAMAGAVGLAAWIAYRVNAQLARHPGQRDQVLGRYSKWRLRHTITLLGVYGTALLGFGWGWTAQGLCSRGTFIFPGAELVILAPFFVGLIGSWACFYNAERALHETATHDAVDPFWTRWSYITFNLRQNLGLVFIPVILLIVVKGLTRVLPDWGVAVGSAVGLLGALTVFALLPWLLRLVLGLKPLPPGALRDRLVATAQRQHFRCSDILVWNTNECIANGMVTGILPMIRYVLLTDRLIAKMSAEEVEAVFGHEIGHIRHQHMLFYFGFLMLSIVVLGCAGILALTGQRYLLPEVEFSDSVWANLGLLPILGLYLFVVFGFISRRCERQADLYGCRTVSCTRWDCEHHEPAFQGTPAGKGLCPTGICIFVEALEKVARLNDISRDRPGWLQSWLHSTIARRVDFLERVRADPKVEPQFQRRVAYIKWGLLLALAAVLIVCVYAIGRDRLLVELGLASPPNTPAQASTDGDHAT